MASSIIEYTVIKIVQAAHHQGDVMYGLYRAIQCSCIFVISVSWKCLKSLRIGKEDQLFKLINKFKFEMEDFPREFPLENCSINVVETEETTAEVYLLSIVEIKNSVWQTGVGTMF